MAATQERLNIAVFIDFDNIEIGVKTTLNQQFDVGTILDAIKERGEVVTKIAYADWTRAGEYSRSLTQHAIRLVQRNLTPGGDKNGADINLALDALEMAFTHPHINAYVIVGGDSDFLSLVEKLKQYDKKVFVVGGRAFTSVILQRNCHEFIAYENLVGTRRPAVRGGRPVASPASLPIAQAFPIVRRALKILADREVSPQTGLLKSTLLQLDSTFSERSYGASSFLDFAQKLAHAGLVQLKQSGRSVMVELNDGLDGSAGSSMATSDAAMDPAAVLPAMMTEPRGGDIQSTAAPALSEPRPDPSTSEARQLGSSLEGVRRAGASLASATGARWPMYLRNVRQILRAADAGFDERRYGFSGLMDLLRGCQREGLVRLERDRRGGVHVYQGPALQRASLPAEPAAGQETETSDMAPVPEPKPRLEAQGLELDSSSGGWGPRSNQGETELEPMPVPVPIDTTAERVGRVTGRRGRGRVPQAAEPPPPRTARRARKTAPVKRTGRSKKTSSDAGDSVEPS